MANELTSPARTNRRRITDEMVEAARAGYRDWPHRPGAGVYDCLNDYERMKAAIAAALAVQP